MENPSGTRVIDLYEVRAQVRSGTTELGLRERHKIDKLERISDAAHKLFARDGYDRTTLRDIAKEAGVALGTLSLYARDKRDLILLIFNKLIPPLLERGLRNTSRSASLSTSLVAFFEPFYHTYALDPVLYRIVLGQIYSGPASVHANQNDLIRQSLIESIEDIILRVQAAGEITRDGDRNLQARSFYFLYFAAVRTWLAVETPEAEQGLADLRALFDLHVTGLLPRT